MKTIKALLKDFLYKEECPTPPEEVRTETVDGDKTENDNTNPKNQNENETETDEIPRHPQLDYPGARQSAGNNQGESGEETRPTGERPDGERAIGDQPSGVNTQESETSQEEPPISKEEYERAVKEAFEKGVIEGRNQQIEEKYFPKEEDGIPHFHGVSSKTLPGSDIFSMARSAY